MDPIHDRNRKILSPLDKKPAEEPVKTDDSADSSASQKGNASSEPVKVEAPKEPITNGGGNGNDVTADVLSEEPPGEPPLVEHLTELRKQLVKSIITFLVFFIGILSTINFWFPYITRDYKLVVLSPLEVISFYTTVSAALAFGLSIPFICHFLWQFVKSGLTEKEGRFLILYSPAILLLFVGGLAFGYFVVNPLSYNFLIKLGEMNFDVMISAKEYARFLLMTTMPIGLMFELPVVALFLASIGILTSSSMKKVRKWSYLTLALISALITPPDFVSQLIILIPMIVLYEGSIYLVTRTERKMDASDAS